MSQPAFSIISVTSQSVSTDNIGAVLNNSSRVMAAHEVSRIQERAEPNNGSDLTGAPSLLFDPAVEHGTDERHLEHHRTISGVGKDGNSTRLSLTGTVPAAISGLNSAAVIGSTFHDVIGYHVRRYETQ